MNKKNGQKKVQFGLNKEKKRLSSPVMMMIICLQTFEYSNRNFIRIAHAMLIRFDSFFQLKKRKRRMRRIKKRIERIHSKCELMRKLIRNENFVSFFVFLFCFFDDIYFNFVKCIDRSIRMNLFFFHQNI